MRVPHQMQTTVSARATRTAGLTSSGSPFSGFLMKAFSSSRHFAQKFTNLNDSADCGALGLPLAEPLHVGHADAHPARRRVLGNVARIGKLAERDLIPRSRVCPAALDHADVAQVGDPQPRDVPDGF